jgi:pilus assembly protein CpaF
MAALGALGGLDTPALYSQLAAAVQVVLHMRRDPDGRRRLAEIGVLVSSSGRIRVLPAWRPGGPQSGWGALGDLVAGRGVSGPW